MPLPNKSQVNLIIDILCEFLLDCYILWDMKLLILIKMILAAKKVCNVLEVDLLYFCYSENDLLIEYVKRKIFVLCKDNEMMNRYLANKQQQPLRPDLTLQLSSEFEKRNAYERQIVKISQSDKNPSVKANVSSNDERKGFKI